MNYKLTRGQIRLAGIRARKGGVEEQNFLVNAFLDYRDSVNKDIRGLRREDYTYSRGYKFINQFIMNEFEDTSVIPTLNEFNEDWESIARTVAHMVKFKESKEHSVEQMEDIERRRMDTLRSKGFIPDDFSDRRLKNFMRFLGREESREIIDLFGNSDTMIDFIFEAYNKRSNSRSKMAKAFAEFLDEYEKDPYHNVDINNMFKKLGIKRLI